MLSRLESDGVGLGVLARFQSHGAVLLVDDDGMVLHVSQACDGVLGRAAQHVVGEPLEALLPGLSVGDLIDDDEDVLTGPAWRLAALFGGAEVKVRAFAAAPGLTGIDVVAVPRSQSVTEAATVERITRWTARLQAAQSRAELFEVACRVVRSLSKFEGVWAARIRDDGNGVVEAAVVSDGAPDLNGSSVAAADLPPGDRIAAGRPAPFFVADVREAANDLEPASTRQLDLSGSALFRPYDVYLDFLASFGARATLSIPVVAGGRTWARLIAHDREPVRLSAARQSELRLVGIAAGVRLRELLDGEANDQRLAHATASARIMRAIAVTTTLVDGLTSDPEALLRLADAASAVVDIDDRAFIVGQPLGDELVAAVLKDARIKLAASSSAVVTSTTMPFSPGGHAGGYLAMRLDDGAGDVVAWVRPERRRTVPWVTVEPGAGPSNQPQKLSDAVSVQARDESSSSAPWTTAQIKAVLAFRAELASVMLGRYSALQQSHGDLQRSNSEFDAFAHTVAHDLRQPIRGITMQTEFFLEDTSGRLSEDEIAQLQTVLRLAGRGSQLLSDLLRYAELGEAAWTTQKIDLATTAAEAIEQLDQSAVQAAEIQVDDGVIVADPSATRQLLANLVGNALKYSKGPANVHVGVTSFADAAAESTPPTGIHGFDARAPVLFVKDRGVGIAPEHAPRVFGLFKRANDTLPEVPGTGAGLAMCQRIAQRHGGDIWLTSEPGHGTTVYTLLPQTNGT